MSKEPNKDKPLGKHERVKLDMSFDDALRAAAKSPITMETINLYQAGKNYATSALFNYNTQEIKDKIKQKGGQLNVRDEEVFFNNNGYWIMFKPYNLSDLFLEYTIKPSQFKKDGKEVSFYINLYAQHINGGGGGTYIDLAPLFSEPLKRKGKIKISNQNILCDKLTLYVYLSEDWAKQINMSFSLLYKKVKPIPHSDV